MAVEYRPCLCVCDGYRSGRRLPNSFGLPHMIMTPHGQADWYKGRRTEIVVKLVPVEVHWTCPKCRRGDMVHNGYTWTTNPPGMHHKCTKCHYLTVIETDIYPRMEYIRKEVKSEAVKAKHIRPVPRKSKSGA